MPTTGGWLANLTCQWGSRACVRAGVQVEDDADRPERRMRVNAGQEEEERRPVAREEVREERKRRMEGRTGRRGEEG
eukprot:1653213-Rhodomonas_salina.1